MTSKGMIIAVWGGIAILVHGFQDGDIPELFALIGGSGPTVTNGKAKGQVAKPGFGYRLIGQALFFGSLTLLGNYSDDAANAALMFLFALTILYIVTNRVTLPVQLSKFMG